MSVDATAIEAAPAKAAAAKADPVDGQLASVPESAVERLVREFFAFPRDGVEPGWRTGLRLAVLLATWPVWIVAAFRPQE